MRYELLKHSLL